MEFFLITALNGLSYGLLLFMLSSGLTIILSLMGVLNFAHASFYMVGAYGAYIVSQAVGFWPALIIAPLAVGLLGALVERYGLRRVHKYGPIPELLLTFGIAYLIAEGVKLVFGLPAVPYRVPAAFDGPMFTLYSTSFPAYRGFMMGVSLFMLLSVYLLIKRTRIGLVIQAALTHPDMVEALGHNVPRVLMLVFGGGAALAGLAGVIGGNAFVIDPSMADSVGPIVYVVTVVVGMGSLAGAFLASILIGLIQTFAITLDYSMLDFFNMIGAHVSADSAMGSLWKLKISQVGPVLPFLLLVLVLIFRPRGLLGTREA
ncbi:MAG: branched-chain amino acid ABC transporter permease [Candidatus Protistobacter heckmanni]|nr:branched-chain amino acid ABC transporter permease [Candidatus Protistobacter heckmanni]